MPEKYDFDAVVVGSGPNGLAAAVTMARAGFSVQVIEAADTIGGGTRSAELTEPGYVHDICSAVHPFGIASPFFNSIDLSKYDLEWIHPQVPLAHPLDDGCVLLERSVEKTSQRLGHDSQKYVNLMSLIVSRWDELFPDVLQPLHLPRHPLLFARFGTLVMHSANHFLKNLFSERNTRSIFAGLAVHGILPFNRISSSSVPILLAAAAHAVGWPLVKGGSQAIADALGKCLIDLGGQISTGIQINSMSDLPRARVALFDVTPKQLASIAGSCCPADYKNRLMSHKYGPGVYKMDWALNAPIPWRNSDCQLAGTVHIGGNYAEIAEAEDIVWQGKHPEKPFVILVQPSLFDSTRAPKDKYVAWAYCHVPNGSTFDISERIESQIERFAPGFRDTIIARKTMNTEEMEAYNQNYVGGDIAGGEQNILRLLINPPGHRRPYVTPLKGVYICSSSMPPGSGVHGMCGFYAAKRALRDLSVN